MKPACHHGKGRQCLEERKVYALPDDEQRGDVEAEHRRGKQKSERLKGSNGLHRGMQTVARPGEGRGHANPLNCPNSCCWIKQ